MSMWINQLIEEQFLNNNKKLRRLKSPFAKVRPIEENNNWNANIIMEITKYAFV